MAIKARRHVLINVLAFIIWVFSADVLSALSSVATASILSLIFYVLRCL